MREKNQRPADSTDSTHLELVHVLELELGLGQPQVWDLSKTFLLHVLNRHFVKWRFLLSGKKDMVAVLISPSSVGSPKNRGHESLNKMNE